jgi:hypothetical protein
MGQPDPYTEYLDLVVDFDHPRVLPWDDFPQEFPPENRVARMDTPYVEALLRQYSLFANRIGLRDIPEVVLQHRAQIDAAEGDTEGEAP